MSTECQTPLINQPFKFLGATVINFSTAIGLGGSESTLSVEMVEDCEASPPDSFTPNLFDGDPNKVIVGDPVLFTVGSFNFGGILQSWTINQNSSGKTFSAKVVDPRQLLQNVSVIIDTYNGTPETAANYVNAYHHMEKNLCSQYGLSLNTDEGTPYLNIMQALGEIQDSTGSFICSPTCSTNGQYFNVDFTTFPGGSNSPFQGFPTYFRLNGPSKTLQEILEEACELAGYEHYVYLDFPQGQYPTIKIGLIDLKQQPSSFATIIDSFNGVATDLSYGQELRNEVTKTVFIGENVHYLSQVNQFVPFFGEEIQNGQKVLVVPYGWDDNGFWILKSIEDLNQTLENPLLTNGPFQISENDIRYAMSGFQGWARWVFINKALGSFNDAIRAAFPAQNLNQTPQVIQNIGNPDPNLHTRPAGGNNAGRAIPAAATAPTPFSVSLNKAEIIEELERVCSWLSNLGNTYYGKQYLSPLNESVCYYLTDYTVNNGELVFSSEPAQSAWIDPGLPVLGLGDPGLEVFKDEDGRIGGFAVFSTLDALPSALDSSDDKGQVGGVVQGFGNFF